MKKKVTKIPKKSAVCACKVGVSKKEQQSVRCAAKETPIKASLESVIDNPTILKNPKDPRLPDIGTTFIKKFKGKDLLIEVKSDGLYWEGKCYKSLSGRANKKCLRGNDLSTPKEIRSVYEKKTHLPKMWWPDGWLSGNKPQR